MTWPGAEDDDDEFEEDEEEGNDEDAAADEESTAEDAVAIDSDDASVDEGAELDEEIGATATEAATESFWFRSCSISTADAALANKPCCLARACSSRLLRLSRSSLALPLAADICSGIQT